MKVYKFGGASVKDAAGVRNMTNIVRDEKGGLFIIVSAMGKTTNALENVLKSFYEGDKNDALTKLRESIDYHDRIIADLWGKAEILAKLTELYSEIEMIIQSTDPASKPYEVWYDSIVSYGELFSTIIVSEYLNKEGVSNNWVDMRKIFITNDRHKDANIDIELSAKRLIDHINAHDVNIFVGQGFIGATEDGVTTTIGREGSDYSAAVAGYILDGESVAIWKDVEGILNGDPKIFAEAEYIPELSYLDAIELAYSGAQIIHPKTIKPLQNKDIPLYVKCFTDKTKPGTIIKKEIKERVDIPILILKHNQVLLTVRPHDFSFVLEEKLMQIFALLDEFHVKVNLIQSSAVDLSVCMDKTRYLDEIVERLQEEEFKATYNTEMELLTIRGYTPEQAVKYAEADDVFLSQKTRRTIRIVRKAIEK